MGVTLMDGAWGTSLWKLAEQAGVEQVPVWRYNLEHPEFVEETAKRYIEAGSEIILTNTFTANRLDVKRCSGYGVEEVVTAGVRIAKKAAEGTGVKVALSIGPLSEMMEPYGDLEEEEVTEIYDEMLSAGVAAGADIILFETFIDLNMMKAAVKAAGKYKVPVFCTMAFEPAGKTIFGNSVEQMITELEPLGISAIGMNCSVAPDEGLGIIEKFRGKTQLPLIFKPNAGKPVLNADGTVSTTFDAERFVEDAAPALGFVSYIGGCCGSSPEYIAMLKKSL